MAILNIVQDMVNVVCPGGEFQCPDRATCCSLGKTGNWGCCPLENVILFSIYIYVYYFLYSIYCSFINFPCLICRLLAVLIFNTVVPMVTYVLMAEYVPNQIRLFKRLRSSTNECLAGWRSKSWKLFRRCVSKLPKSHLFLFIFAKYDQ